MTRMTTDRNNPFILTPLCSVQVTLTVSDFHFIQRGQVTGHQP